MILPVHFDGFNQAIANFWSQGNFRPILTLTAVAALLMMITNISIQNIHGADREQIEVAGIAIDTVIAMIIVQVGLILSSFGNPYTVKAAYNPHYLQVDKHIKITDSHFDRFKVNDIKAISNGQKIVTIKYDKAKHALVYTPLNKTGKMYLKVEHYLLTHKNITVSSMTVKPYGTVAHCADSKGNVVVQCINTKAKPAKKTRIINIEE